MMMPPSIIDIEASGFGVGSYLIEVGYVTHHGKRWCSLITPCDDWQHWNSVAEQLYHISHDTLLAHDKSIETVTTQLNETFHNQVVYTDCWLQDLTSLNCLFEMAETTPHFKFEDLRTVLTPYQQSAWH